MRDIENYKGLYAVTDGGRVYSHITGKYLKPGNNGTGYRFVVLTKDEEKQNHYLHRLVADAYLENPENKPEVNHMSGDKSDNSVANLEYMTAKENIQHAYDMGLNGKKKKITENFCKRCDDIVPVSDKGRCLTHGTLTKGFSGNTQGRPKKAGTDTDAPVLDSEKYGSDAVKALEYLLETTTSRAEAYRLAKDLAPYQKPKLSSIESKEHKETKLVIEWIGDTPSNDKTMKLAEEVTKKEIINESDILLINTIDNDDK